jgi:uncharacterized protein YbjT (DUF2867 family)
MGENLMRVAVFGGTGFVGGYLVRGLLAANHEPSLLVRKGSERKIVEPDRCRITSGDISSLSAIEATLEGSDAVIYNIGLLREFSNRGITFEEAHVQGVRRVIELAQRHSAGRLLLMSANGVKNPGTAYQETKFRAEEHVKSSGLQWTIFRPSIIFGDSGGMQEITHQLYNQIVKPPVPAGVFPGVVMSPVSVIDVADAFVNALANPETIGQVYELGGPEVLSWEDMVRRVADAVDTKKSIVPIPIGLLKIGAMLFDWLPFFPATREQLTMLEEGNTAQPDALEKLIGRPLTPFTPKNLAYLKK